MSTQKLFLVAVGLSSLSVTAFAHGNQNGGSSGNNRERPSCKSSDVGEMTYDEDTDSIWICKSSGLVNIRMSSFRGDAGATGVTGATGPQGPSGAKGATGAAGVVGATGSQGPSGAKGATGAAGVVGATGAQGPQGLPGLPGMNGGIGPMGPQGLTGQRGEEGPAGPQGLPGPSASNVMPILWSGGCDRAGGDLSVDFSQYYCTSVTKISTDPSYIEGAADGIGVTLKKTGFYRVRFWSLARSDDYGYIYGWMTLDGVRVAATQTDISNHLWHNYGMDTFLKVETEGQVVRIHVPVAGVSNRWYNTIEGWSGIIVQYMGPLAN